MPAIEMDRALGEVKSLGVAESGLRKLSRAAVDFTMEYGGAAQDFVRASYDIQSAIAGLTDDELSRFTTASATVAAATKSSSQTITAYMGTMYGIFKDQADAMGKSKWVEQVAGQTATAVQMFKTTAITCQQRSPRWVPVQKRPVLMRLNSSPCWDNCRPP